MSQTLNRKSDVRFELLRQLSQSIQRGDTSGGLRMAKNAHQKMTAEKDLLAGQFRCLEAKLWLLSGDYHKSLTSARVSASYLTPFGESEELAEAFLIAGKSLINIGNYREAETALLDADSLYRRTDNDAGRINAVNQLARVSFIHAEYKSALKYLLEAIKLAEKTGDRKKLAFLWGNLGRVYTFLGNFKKAKESLKIDLQLCEEFENESEKAKALLSLGYIEMQQERYEKAEQRYDEANSILRRLDMKRELIICRTYYGELRLKCGDLSTSRRLLNEAAEAARTMAPESSLLVMPLRLLAELELINRNLSSASRLANKAYDLARKINEPIEKACALRLIAQIAFAKKPECGNTIEKSRQTFLKVLEILHDYNARFELAETLVIMAECGTSSQRRRLANLFRAGDIYNRLGIESKLEKTQALINQSEVSAAPQKPSKPKSDPKLPTIITINSRMEKIMEQIALAAKSRLPVLLMGETGTGKDLLAKYYHAHSGRTGDFVAVNCAAFPDTLLEAELFGYRKGAFTGAGADKEGLLHRANGGTFFLDEIGEMSLISQAKLLTVIETCRARRLGATEEESLDIRFIAATNCNLTEIVEANTFRRDLFYRLSGISFKIPALSERPEDIPLLLRYFLENENALAEGQTLDPELINQFSSRSWPGNIRQLESEVKKLVLFSEVAREDSLGNLAEILVQNDEDNETASLMNQVEQFEKALIIKALRKSGGNKSLAARTLSIHESTLRAKMKRYELNMSMIS
ncbi:MAG: sigma 54-interacting transcriptional regulator [candidate division Zixibacteria bacterium]